MTDLFYIALALFVALCMTGAFHSMRRSQWFQRLKLELEPDDWFEEREREEW